MTSSSTRIAITSLTMAVLLTGIGSALGSSPLTALSLTPCSIAPWVFGCGGGASSSVRSAVPIAPRTAPRTTPLTIEQVCGSKPAASQCEDGSAPIYMCNKQNRMWNRRCPPSNDICGNHIPTTSKCRMICTPPGGIRPLNVTILKNGCHYACEADCLAYNTKPNTCGNNICETGEKNKCPRDCSFSQTTGDICLCPRSMTWDGTSCVQMQEIQCPDESAPVCGCDGRTYRNSCNARKGGVKSFQGGSCAGVGSQFASAKCGNNICEPPTENYETCPGDCRSIEGNACTCPVGWMWNRDTGACTTHQSDLSCLEQQGTGVCGCDGNEYQSSCQAAMMGIKSVEEGSCPRCGDRTCNGAETSLNCALDCGAPQDLCGNGVCDLPSDDHPGETGKREPIAHYAAGFVPPPQKAYCPADCPLTATPVVCPLIKCAVTTPQPGTTCTAIPVPPDANGCPSGCPTFNCVPTGGQNSCGDHQCNNGENHDTCPGDCPQVVCSMPVCPVPPRPQPGYICRQIPTEPNPNGCVGCPRYECSPATVAECGNNVCERELGENGGACPKPISCPKSGPDRESCLVQQRAREQEIIRCTNLICYNDCGHDPQLL